MAIIGLLRQGSLTRIDARDVHRIVSVVFALGLSVVAAGLYFRASWATALWPWPDVRMTYIFLASVLAAAIAPSLWIGITGELAALAPGALNTLLLNLMFAAYLGFRGVREDDWQLLAGAAVNLAVVPVFVALLKRSRAMPVRDTRPMPRVVTYAQWTFCGLLIVVGIPLLIQVDHVFPWELTPQTSTMFGCVFLGAAGYFAYVARERFWAFGAPGLFGFLGYDLVLFTRYWDFVRHPGSGLSGSSSVYGAYGSYYGSYGTTGNGVNERSLAVYLTVLVASTLFAAFFLFVYRPTRLRIASFTGLRRVVPLVRPAA